MSHSNLTSSDKCLNLRHDKPKTRPGLPLMSKTFDIGERKSTGQVSSNKTDLIQGHFPYSAVRCSTHYKQFFGFCVSHPKITHLSVLVR